MPSAIEAMWKLVPSVPTAALFDQSGALVYFGPYSSGPSCGSGVSFVEVALSRLTEGTAPAWVNDLAFGCFCQTPI